MPKPTSKARQERLAAALRANLKRRKAKPPPDAEADPKAVTSEPEGPPRSGARPGSRFLEK